MNTEEKLNSIKVIFEALDPRERLILFARHILGMSYGLIGKELGVSRERIRQIRERGFRKIRKAREKLLKNSVEELGLPEQQLKALKSSGIKTVDDLVGKTARDLLVIRNFGEKSLQKIESQLGKYNLVQRQDEVGYHFERRGK